eukprot:1894827-Pleurochrysis_carterae.AAC.2
MDMSEWVGVAIVPYEVVVEAEEAKESLVSTQTRKARKQTSNSSSRFQHDTQNMHQQWHQRGIGMHHELKHNFTGQLTVLSRQRACNFKWYMRQTRSKSGYQGRYILAPCSAEAPRAVGKRRWTPFGLRAVHHEVA